MSFSEIEMNTSTLQSDIGTLEDLIRRMQEQKRKLTSTVGELNSMWTGQANAAFNAQFEKDMVNFENMLQVLREVLESLENARKEYDGCEQRIEGIINSIAV